MYTWKDGLYTKTGPWPLYIFDHMSTLYNAFIIKTIKLHWPTFVDEPHADRMIVADALALNGCHALSIRYIDSTIANFQGQGSFLYVPSQWETM